MSPQFEEIELTIHGDCATVTMDRPDALNAITPLMLDELKLAFDSLDGNSNVRFAVLTGAGRAFSAGVDLKALGDRQI